MYLCVVCCGLLFAGLASLYLEQWECLGLEGSSCCVGGFFGLCCSCGCVPSSCWLRAVNGFVRDLVLAVCACWGVFAVVCVCFSFG